jgi:DNA-binding MarR family transcriptional regulator
MWSSSRFVDLAVPEPVVPARSGMGALPNMRHRRRQSDAGALMGTIRRSRTQRPDERVVHVTPRDLAILRAIGRMKRASLRQIQSLFFGDDRTAARRMAALFAGGYVEVRVPALHEQNLISLTSKGRALLIATATAEDDDLHLGGPLRADYRHLIAINDVRVALVLACRSRTDVRLDVFLADHDLRRAAGMSVAPYVPDALVRLLVGESEPRAERGVVIEVDRGFESPRYICGSKIRVLMSLWQAGATCWGLANWRPLLLAPRRRLRTLARPACEAGAADLLLLGDLGALSQSSVLASYATAGDVARAEDIAAVSWTSSVLDLPPTPMPASREGLQ